MQAFGDGQTYSHENLNKMFVKNLSHCYVLFYTLEKILYFPAMFSKHVDPNLPCCIGLAAPIELIGELWNTWELLALG